MGKIVLVTGGTGYIGSWIVKYLLERKYSVRITVRDKSKTKKFQHLLDIAEKENGDISVWKGDLLKPGSFDEAAQGADAIIHAASPFTLRIKDPYHDLIDPALKGTQNVLNAATKSGTVKRIVLTSSVAAIYGDNVDMAEQGLSEFTEDHFNSTSSAKHQPYSYSKLVAEKEAWRIAGDQKQWKLLVINPAFVVGPSLADTSDSESINFMKNVLKGKFFFGAPDLTFGYVDVRDVALAHILALENEAAEGRHILSERTLNFMGVADSVRRCFGNKKYRLPIMRAPKIFLYSIGGLFNVTPKFVKRNIGHTLKLNSTKSKVKLGLKYREFDDTIRDMVDKMHHLGIV